MRRWLPLAWAVVLAAAGAGSAVAAIETATAAEVRAPAVVDPPLLSIRRAPDLAIRPAADAALMRDLDAIVADAPGTACLVVDAPYGRLYEHRPDLPLIPASTAKLALAHAALDIVGPDHVYRTSLVATAAAVDGRVDGDVVLVGSGDPVLAQAAYTARFRHQPQPRTPIERLADDVAASGITEITGSVLADESRYDSARYVGTWPPVYVQDHETGPMTAVSVNDGFVAWEPRVVPAADPAVQAAAVLTDLLRQRGVDVHGAPGTGTGSGREVVSVVSPSMADIVAHVVRESDNHAAELILKELGVATVGTGSTADGARAVLDSLSASGLPMAGVDLRDGSGLDRGNRVTCRFVDALLALHVGDAVDAGLSVAGESGTLADRRIAASAVGRVRAKTGSLDGVVALSGFVDGDHGPLRFAFIANGLPTSGVGFGLQERVAAALASWPRVDPGVAEALAP